MILNKENNQSNNTYATILIKSSNGPDKEIDCTRNNLKVFQDRINNDDNFIRSIRREFGSKFTWSIKGKY